MTNEEETKRAQDIQSLIDSVPMVNPLDTLKPGHVTPVGQPMNASTPGGGQVVVPLSEPAMVRLEGRFAQGALQVCVICEAAAQAGKPIVHRLGCKFGPPVTPGRLTSRVRCTECDSVGFNDAEVKLGHKPGCSRAALLTPATDTCTRLVANPVPHAASARECGKVAMAVRARRLLCAQCAADFDQTMAETHAATPMEGPKPAQAVPDVIAAAEALIAKQGKALASQLIQIATLAAVKATEALKGDKPASTIGDLLSAAHVALKLADDADRLGDKAIARR